MTVRIKEQTAVHTNTGVQKQTSDLTKGGRAMIENEKFPLGFTMALAQNSEALLRFASMPEKKQQRILREVRSIRSKSEMRAYVERMT